MFEMNWKDNYCDAYEQAEFRYFWPESEHFVCDNATEGFCHRLLIDMIHFEKYSSDTLTNVWHIFFTILPVLFFFSIAYRLTQLTKYTLPSTTFPRFGLEFIVSVIPTVLCINVYNQYVEQIVIVCVICSLVLIWHKRCFAKAQERDIDIGGRRPRLLTLARSTINYLTGLCILAIDFPSFPNDFRKTRRFGAGLMDVGIGLFVYSMGLVSRPVRRWPDIKRLLYMVTLLIVLGGLRTIIILAIDYHQDEHEYGVHLNAFFTLGLTKLFGGLISILAWKEIVLIPLSLVVLTAHQTILELGLSNYVMDEEVARTTFWSANREGLSSLPGFVGLYIITMYFGSKFKVSGNALTYREFMFRFKSMAISSALLWLFLVISTNYFGIARVTCNLSYAIWMLAIGNTMGTLFMFAFDFVLHTLWPVTAETFDDLDAIESVGDAVDASKMHLINKQTKVLKIPVLVEAINQNGLIYFLIANILTGGVNIFLKPEDRTTFESVVILTLYMFLSTGFVYLLYRLKIRIA